jgi:hypothetical protein
MNYPLVVDGSSHINAMTMDSIITSEEKRLPDANAIT